MNDITKLDSFQVLLLPPTLSQKQYDSPHNKGWGYCNRVCPAFVSILLQKPADGADVASAPTMTGSVSMQRFRLFLGQCIDVCQCSSISRYFLLWQNCTFNNQIFCH